MLGSYPQPCSCLTILRGYNKLGVTAGLNELKPAVDKSCCAGQPVLLQ